MHEVRLINPEETYRLRQLVLRPMLTVDQVGAAHDTAEGSFHVGAINKDGQAIAIMTVMRDCVPNTDRVVWRIRGMASDPDARGTGCGGAALEFGMAHAWEQHRETIWCNARKVAYGFYERYGFELVSDEFDIPGIGPHKVMIIDPQ